MDAGTTMLGRISGTTAVVAMVGVLTVNVGLAELDSFKDVVDIAVIVVVAAAAAAAAAAGVAVVVVVILGGLTTVTAADITVGTACR